MRIKGILSVVCFFSVAFLINNAYAQESADAKVPPPKATVFDAMFANMDAWKQGDVLVKVTETYDSLGNSESPEPSGVIIKRTRFIRNAFDYEQKRFSQFELIDSSTTDFSASKFIPVHESTWEGFTIDLESKTGFRNASKSSEGRSRIDQERDLLDRYMAFHDYRALPTRGLDAYGDTRDSYVKATQALLIGDFFASAKDGIGNTIEIRFFRPFNEEFEKNGEKLFANGMQTTIVFDKSSSMKIRQRADFLIGKVLPKEKFVSGSRINWKEIDGIYVPVSYSSKSRQRMMFIDRQESVDFTVSAKFHWFGLNEPLPENLFDGSILKDEESFLKVVLPAKAGATTLQEDSNGDAGSEK